MAADHSLVEALSSSPAGPSDTRTRLYEAYVTTHGTGATAGHADVALLKLVIPYLPHDRGARVLDVGCGAGDLVQLLHEQGFRAAAGVDVSAEQVALAASRGVQGVREGDLLEQLAQESGALDAVVALDVLEHFSPDETLGVLDAIAGSLRPGGVLIARTPNATSPFAGRYRYGDLTHGLSYTTRSLKQALAAAHFSSIAFHPVNPVPHGLLSAARFGVWAVIAAMLKLALVAETGELRGHIVTQNLMVIARR
jgi:2-polyprenyl-3-methyl-5-hydroxy-6-metoxy-1,4-benzoquinol methylase